MKSVNFVFGKRSKTLLYCGRRLVETIRSCTNTGTNPSTTESIVSPELGKNYKGNQDSKPFPTVYRSPNPPNIALSLLRFSSPTNESISSHQQPKSFSPHPYPQQLSRQHSRSYFHQPTSHIH